MDAVLVEVPGMPDCSFRRWNIRALEIDGKSPALAALRRWQQSEPADFTKIMTSLRMAVGSTRVHNEKWVKKCQNPAFREIYEARAHGRNARLMFFYLDEAQAMIVCTNECWKNSDNQDLAFAHAAALKQIFEQNRTRPLHAKNPEKPKRNRR